LLSAAPKPFFAAVTATCRLTCSKTNRNSASSSQPCSSTHANPSPGACSGFNPVNYSAGVEPFCMEDMICCSSGVSDDLHTPVAGWCPGSVVAGEAWLMLLLLNYMRIYQRLTYTRSQPHSNTKTWALV
jgi:hypothetical protein